MIVKSKFKPAWWLPGSHLQTMFATSSRSKPNLSPMRERIELPDGDFLDIDWVEPKNSNEKCPIILILHGLGGSVESHYAGGVLTSIIKNGWRGAFMHFRGASGTPNRLPRGYHSGDTADVQFVIQQLTSRYPKATISAVGYSLGGNVLLKWLGETKETNPIKTAVAISVPFELHKASNRLHSGFSRFYQWYLLSTLKEMIRYKFTVIDSPIDLSNLANLKTFWEFDEYVTAPLHGFSSANDYYTKASSKPYLQHIKKPTLILHAINDPFMTPDVVPKPNEISEHITLELSKSGGHVGFITGKFPFWPKYWLDERIIQHLKLHHGDAKASFSAKIDPVTKTI